MCVCVFVFSGVIERWELLQAQSRSERPSGPEEPQQLTSDLDDVTSWLGRVIPELQRLSHCDPVVSIEDMTARAKHFKVQWMPVSSTIYI